MKEKRNQNHSIPKDHPRYKSLKYRHKIIEGMKNLAVAEAGLIAHGRGECFDYILGERTNETAKKAMKAAVAALLLAKSPIISVNGNTAALVPKELVELSEIVNAPLEINLFYYKEGRIEAIKKILEEAGATDIRGTLKEKLVEIEGLESNRRFVQSIIDADLVMVPLEDGDRTETLKKRGKNVIAVDLNPISRTAIWADITIVDNIIRTLPEMIKIAKDLKSLEKEQLITILNNFDNKKNIIDTLELIKEYIEAQKENAFKILKS
ncbi:MAG: phosphopantothenate/pantothenate synthetase [Promethearchaeota archaeon]|nr:MAG: phosphopantothenate/pantothenate synthetase [Candidatus Lokiarchaeota archaeon]